MLSFKEFKDSGALSDPYVSEGINGLGQHKVLKENIRLLIGTLVVRIQEHHDQGVCPCKIGRNTVIIEHGVAYLVGETEEYTEKKAEDNYAQLAEFIVKKMLRKIELPYSLTHFIELLRDKPLDKVDHIVMHYGILVDSSRRYFLSQSYLAFYSMDESTLKSYRVAIDKSPCLENWTQFLPDSGPLRNCFTKNRGRCHCGAKVYAKTGKVEKFLGCGGVNSYIRNCRGCMLRFHRDCVDHNTVKKLPLLFDENEDPEYNAMDIDGKMKADRLLDKLYTHVRGKPTKEEQHIVSLLESHFPRFQTELQSDLYSEGIMKLIGATRVSCEEYKKGVQYDSSGLVKEPIRFFIWGLVQNLQKDHKLGKCPAEISEKTVMIGRLGMAYIQGEKDEYTKERAEKNYKELHNYLITSIFKGKEVPPSIEHFFKLLLRNDPWEYKNLISRHYGILPNSYRIKFIVNLFLFPSLWNYKSRKKVVLVLQSIEFPEDVEACIQDHRTLNGMMNSGNHSMVWGKVKAVAFSRYCKDIVHHLNICNLQYRVDKKKLVTVEELVDQLLLRFPTVFSNIQEALFNKKLLLHLCILPTDRFWTRRRKSPTVLSPSPASLVNA